jgi:hypothetical protein
MGSLSSDSALQGLSLDIELAGAAMACRYSSSDEYEAALIAERRRAGAYDVPSRHRPILWTALAVCAVASVFLAF